MSGSSKQRRTQRRNSSIIKPISTTIGKHLHAYVRERERLDYLMSTLMCMPKDLFTIPPLSAETKQRLREVDMKLLEEGMRNRPA